MKPLARKVRRYCNVAETRGAEVGSWLPPVGSRVMSISSAAPVWVGRTTLAVPSREGTKRIEGWSWLPLRIQTW